MLLLSLLPVDCSWLVLLLYAVLAVASGVDLLGCVLCVSVSGSAGSQAMLAPYLSPFTSTSCGGRKQWVKGQRRGCVMVVGEL